MPIPPLPRLFASLLAGPSATAPHAREQHGRRTDRYLLERVFVGLVMALSIAGFWNLYLGERASPTPLHHLHALTSFAWLTLLLVQISLVAANRNSQHRKLGMAVLFLGPLLVATTAMLSVHSAQRGLLSGEGDFLIVQNVMATLELALLIVFAFVLKKRSKLHGSFLLGTALLFMGIALFFALTSFVPGFRIEGPDTFHRFETAVSAIRYVCLGVGVLFFVKDPRNGWPLLLAGASFFLNELVGAYLTRNGLIEPLTEFVGSMNQPLTFVGGFVVLLALLAATGIRGARRV